jgi:hypothetical protein
VRRERQRGRGESGSGNREKGETDGRRVYVVQQENSK